MDIFYKNLQIEEESDKVVLIFKYQNDIHYNIYKEKQLLLERFLKRLIHLLGIKKKIKVSFIRDKAAKIIEGYEDENYKHIKMLKEYIPDIEDAINKYGLKLIEVKDKKGDRNAKLQ